jgi:uncharacterized protein (TIGR03067 family)
MNRRILLSVCSVLGLFLMAGSSSSTTHQPAEKKEQEKGIPGVWTIIHSEVEGDGLGSLRNPGGRFSASPLPAGPGGALPPFIWRISQEEIQSGWENLNFPRFRYHYQLNPGGKMGTIDLVALDKEGKKTEGKPMQGIYLLTDDILMICYALDGEPRPERFTTSAKSRSVLVILRRGNALLNPSAR